MATQHPVEFKISATIQFLHSERSATQVAGQLGISCKTLLSWANDQRYAITQLAEVDALRVEVRRLRDQCEILKSSWDVDRQSMNEIFTFIMEHLARYTIELLCATFEVSKSGFYAWKRRLPSDHDETDVELMALIEEIFEANHGTYGSPRGLSRPLLNFGAATKA